LKKSFSATSFLKELKPHFNASKSTDVPAAGSNLVKVINKTLTQE
jgi:hypothetical protein